MNAGMNHFCKELELVFSVHRKWRRKGKDWFTCQYLHNCSEQVTPNYVSVTSSCSCCSVIKKEQLGAAGSQFLNTVVSLKLSKYVATRCSCFWFHFYVHRALRSWQWCGRKSRGQLFHTSSQSCNQRLRGNNQTKLMWTLEAQEDTHTFIAEAKRVTSPLLWHF